MDEPSPFEFEEIGNGDKFMAAVPWKAQIHAPDEFKDSSVNSTDPPMINLNLEWVHGYRSHDSRNNISILLDQSIVY